MPPAVSRFADAVVSRANILHYDGVDRIREAFTVVPRDQFLEDRFKSRALEDSKLPCGAGQTSPAPYLIARMLAAARITQGASVLEISCGSGYVSALMCVLGARVFATESIGLKAQATRKRLDALGLNRILVATGHLAWSDHAPFDAIVSHQLVSAEHELTNLVKLLNPNCGILVAPIAGDEHSRLITVRVDSSNSYVSYI